MRVIPATGGKVACLACVFVVQIASYTMESCMLKDGWTPLLIFMLQISKLETYSAIIFIKNPCFMTYNSVILSWHVYGYSSGFTQFFRPLPVIEATSSGKVYKADPNVPRDIGLSI